MAKWGEGDPRWIVEERADATNVNNWHWTEKNATPWSKQRLRELLEKQEIADGSIVISFGEIKKLEGEATANNRKSKLIFLYEWEVELNWTARLAGSELEYKGHIEIPNLSDENDASEVDVNFYVETKGPAEAQIRHIFNRLGVERVRELVGMYIKELKEEFSKGIILPTDKVKPQVVVKERTVDKNAFQNAVISTSSKPSVSTDGPVQTERVATTETFRVPPSRLFECLSDQQLVKAWANPTKWDFKNDGDFACFGGNVTGTFLEIVPDRLITMKWRLKSFPEGHHAIVKFNLKDLADSTELEIDASSVPVSLLDQTKQGFERYYLVNLGRTFGFSSRIF
ncbi:unnamed protein product, partial [Mesorhabditis belari]|uniref:Activator of Hsp90 ATPase AHSA1-like N-terminal domain-containing protein n=1 Tax=Mesorhabditis belari TaxID=2138241 RepID=A0AAF3FU10_9BILA